MTLDAVRVLELRRRCCSLFLRAEREEESGDDENEERKNEFHTFSAEDCADVHHSIPPLQYEVFRCL